MWIRLEFLLGKWLSVKVPINKEDFRFVCRFLARWKFDFLVWKWLRCFILVGFNDIWYDKWFDELDFWILLDFVENFEDVDKVKF